MKPLVILKEIDIFSQKLYEEPKEWQLRPTVKVLVKKGNKIALVTNRIHKFYLLPGGGIDAGESVLEAAEREAREEIGYSIISARVLGYTEEYRSRDKKHYMTYGVIAEAGASTGKDLRTEREIELGLITHWFDMQALEEIFKNQLEKFQNEKSKFYNTGFNLIRDKIFLKQLY